MTIWIWDLETDGVVATGQITLANVVVLSLTRVDCREPGMGSANRTWRDRLKTISES